MKNWKRREEIDRRALLNAAWLAHHAAEKVVAAVMFRQGDEEIAKEVRTLILTFKEVSDAVYVMPL